MTSWKWAIFASRRPCYPVLKRGWSYLLLTTILETTKRETKSNNLVCSHSPQSWKSQTVKLKVTIHYVHYWPQSWIPQSEKLEVAIQYVHNSPQSWKPQRKKLKATNVHYQPQTSETTKKLKVTTEYIHYWPQSWKSQTVKLKVTIQHVHCSPQSWDSQREKLKVTNPSFL